MDLILVGFVAGLTFGGWRTGFLHRLAGLAFAAISFVAGAYLRVPLGDLINGLFPSMPADYAELLGYAFAFPIILGVIHVVAYPFLKDRHMTGITREFDKALGAIFGFIEGVLILSILVVIFDTYFANGQVPGETPGLGILSSLVGSFNESYTVQLLRQTTVPIVLAILGPLLPKDISGLIPGGVPGLPGIRPVLNGNPGQVGGPLLTHKP
ncbi:MAG TPA: CvpA family protein [Candidatus Limnocylindrales bacterium]|jgi:uncharacterized membrane protein required for colicin V production